MQTTFPDLANEMARAELGDARLSRRLGMVVGALAERPGKSLPKALVTNAALEATYRFMSNDAVTPDRILEPHIAASFVRAAAAACAFAIHDTTDCEFKGERAGVGRLTGRRRGFFAHVCLLAGFDGRPLGIGDVHTWVRTDAAPGRKARATYDFKTRAKKESDRWGEAVARVDARAHEGTRVVHIMDREGDFYRLVEQLVGADAEFVIRGSHMDRRLADGRTLAETLPDVPAQFPREIVVSERKPERRPRRLPTRAGRAAHVLIGSTTITMKRSWSTPAADGADLALNLVRVWEPSPPDGEPAVEWTLLTSLPVTTPAEVAFVVDAYRRRWLIEELFKALKTGCQFEKLQLESASALLNAFATMLPVAVALLDLRYAARERPDTPATGVLTPLQYKLLRNCVHTRMMPLVTARDAMLAVARLGGHIKNNGDPGWQVLGRGYEDLLALEQGARIALEM